jgi:hypothetical protein
MQTWARSRDAPLGVTNQGPEVLLMAVCPKCGSDRLKIIGQSNTNARHVVRPYFRTGQKP